MVTGSGPTVFGISDDPEAVAAPARRRLPARRRGMKFTWLAAAAALAGWLIARRHKQQRWFQIGELVAIAAAVLIGVGVIKLPNFEQVLEDARPGARHRGPTSPSACSPSWRPGAFLGFVAPGRDRRDRRRPRRRPGRDLAAGADRDRLGLLPARRPHVLRARQAQGPPLAAQVRRAAEDHRGPARPGREAARQPRRGDDHRRALPRVRAPAEPVHRRRRRGCRCGASCPTTCSPPAPGRSRSARSASSSGARSTSSRPTSAAACSRSARWSR